MGDGVTVNWKMNATNGGGTVSLCDGPARGQNKFMGPIDDAGEKSLTFATQALQGLRAAAMKYAPRDNATEQYGLRVSRECADGATAFYYENIFPSLLAPQADLAVTMTIGVTPVTYFLKSAVLENVVRQRKGVSVSLTFRFKGGLWTTS